MNRLLLLVVVAMICAAQTFAAPIDYAPTAADAVPAAILGKGAAPRGTSVAYFPADAKTMGYLAEPAGSGANAVLSS